MENPFPVEELQRILPVLVLFGTGAVALIVDLFLRDWRQGLAHRSDGVKGKWALRSFSMAGVILAVFFLWMDWARPPAVVFQGALQVDAFSNAIAAIILLGTLLTVASTSGPLRRLGLEHGEFYALILFAAGAMILLAQSNNLIMIFLSLETFSMAVYILTAYTRDHQRSVEGALKYFLLGGLASGFLLLGLAFIFGATDAIRLDVIRNAVSTGGNVDPPLLLAGLALTLVGFGFKVGAFPFHTWIPDVYESAPSMVTGFMSVTVKSAGIAALVRFALGIATSEEVRPPLVDALWWVAVGTMVFANLVALAQSSAKRMLAYSAISHTGYLLVGLVAALSSSDGSAGAPILFYLLPYTLMTFGSFAILSCLGRESAEGETFDSFRGLSERQPVLAFCMMVFMVSLSGIPPTAGFWGKLYLFREAVSAGHWPLALVGILTSIVSVYYYLRLVVVMYMQPEAETPPVAESFNWGAAMAVAVAAAAVLGIGFWPDYFLSQSADSIKTVFLFGK